LNGWVWAVFSPFIRPYFFPSDTPRGGPPIACVLLMATRIVSLGCHKNLCLGWAPSRPAGVCSVHCSVHCWLQLATAGLCGTLRMRGPAPLFYGHWSLAYVGGCFLWCHTAGCCASPLGHWLGGCFFFPCLYPTIFFSRDQVWAPSVAARTARGPHT
jgi:hypothetical protein